MVAKSYMLYGVYCEDLENIDRIIMAPHSMMDNSTQERMNGKFYNSTIK